MATQRRKLLFSGHVQGVGFRQTTVMLARDLPLAGEVRNLPDGRVEVIVEGTAPAIDQLVERLREHFGSMIRKIEQHVSSAQGLTGSLRIAY